MTFIPQSGGCSSIQSFVRSDVVVTDQVARQDRLAADPLTPEGRRGPDTLSKEQDINEQLETHSGSDLDGEVLKLDE